jgi:glycosyltransferase involved in cell wall biosynthesis
MKVLHLVWNLIRGGTEGQCARVAMELARRGRDTHRVVVFRREGFFLEQVEQVCGPVEEIGIRRLASWETMQAIRHLAGRIKKESFQLLHAWDADAAIFGQFIAGMAGVPLITSRRDLGQIYPMHKMWLMKRADQKAVAIVANAEAIVNEFTKRGTPRDKFRVIPNILNIQEFDRLCTDEFSGKSALPAGHRMVMVTRLDPEKDVPTFIQAAYTITNVHPEASFVIAGDGIERRLLESMAATRELQSNMVFLGDVTDVPSLLKTCLVGVLTPSRNEGLSNTILEYMAAGLPVVATDCGGNRELVRPPSGGYIVPAGDADALAKVSVELLRTLPIRKSMGDFNRQQVVAHHQPDVVGNQFEELYRQVING